MKRSAKPDATHSVMIWRQAVMHAYEALQDWFGQYMPGEDAIAFDRSLWGEKDSYLSTLSRLIQLDMKLVELQAEQGKSNTTAPEPNVKPEDWDLTHDEWKMMAEACARQLSVGGVSSSVNRGKNRRSKR